MASPARADPSGTGYSPHHGDSVIDRFDGHDESGRRKGRGYVGATRGFCLLIGNGWALRSRWR